MPQKSHSFTPQADLVTCILLIALTAMGYVQAQTGLFGSGTHFDSPRIGQTSFDGASQEAFVPATGGFQAGGVLTTDGNHIFWANFTSINRTHLQTRVTETLASYEPGAFHLKSITTDGLHLYIAHGRKISKFGRDGRLIRDVGESTSYVTGIVTDGIFIYWSDEEEGLFRMKLDGTERSGIHTERNIMGMSAGSSFLCWANDRDRLIRRCDLDGGNPETLVDLAAVFGGTLLNGDRANWLVSGLAVTSAHIYWSSRGSYRGIYRCDLNGGNPERLTHHNYNSEASLTAYPSDLFPEPMEPVRPVLRHDSTGRSVILEWPAIAGRRYLLFKSTDLERFTQEGDVLTSGSSEHSTSFHSPERSAFFVVRKLPGIFLP